MVGNYLTLWPLLDPNSISKLLKSSYCKFQLQELWSQWPGGLSHVHPPQPPHPLASRLGMEFSEQEVHWRGLLGSLPVDWDGEAGGGKRAAGQGSSPGGTVTARPWRAQGAGVALLVHSFWPVSWDVLPS